MRCEASAAESCDCRVAFSARSFERAWVALSSRRFSRSTARFTKTTPARSTPPRAMSAIAPLELVRFALARDFGAVRGEAFAGARLARPGLAVSAVLPGAAARLRAGVVRAGAATD